MMSSLPPGALLMLGAFILPLLKGRARQGLMLLLPLLSLAHMWMLPEGTTTVEMLGYTLEPIRVDRLSRIFGVVFHIAALVASIYSLHVKDRVQQIAGLAYAGSAIAAAFAGDLITLFVWWEVTAFTSVFLIWARRTERANRVGLRYLVIQVTSGVILLAGAMFHVHETGSIAFDSMGDGQGGVEGIGAWLILLAFGIKAAFPLLHSWLKDAYPEATVTGTVWLATYTTKLAIYALCRGYAGTELLIPIGAAMTAFPIFFAVLENDLRRVLAYSLNNQLGFMVVGIGIGTELAINGAVAHAFAHILYKALLFMSMGAVLYRVGTVRANELGGLYKSMPWTTFFCIIGAMSISAFPLFSGFVSKSMTMTAAASEHHTFAFLVLLFASAGVMDHSGIKVPFFAFFAKPHGKPKTCEEAPTNMLVAMGIAAAACIGMGVFYQPLYSLLPYQDVLHSEDFHGPYDTTHVVTQLQLLLFSAGAFVFLVKTKLYPAEVTSVNLDADVVYKRAMPQMADALWSTSVGLGSRMRDRAEATVIDVVAAVRTLHSPNGGLLGTPWPSGQTAMWAAIVLVVSLLLYYS
jgi:multicomponent Na+:H+ antiporter subunit D